MSWEDVQNARRLLHEAERHTSSITNMADKARAKAQIAAGWCQVHQADQ